MAGVVALILATNPSLTPTEVKEVVRLSCVRIDETGGEYNAKGHSVYYGYGRVDAALAIENARKSVKPAGIAFEGKAKFATTGEVKLKPGVMAGDTQPPQKMLGISLKIAPAVNGLHLRYKINVPGPGIRQNAAEGDFVGADKSTQRIIGVSIALEGAAANDYVVEYSARLKGQAALASAKNGAFCGTEKKTGKTIEGLSVTVRKKA